MFLKAVSKLRELRVACSSSAETVTVRDWCGLCLSTSQPFLQVIRTVL
jgi:hypothetical protein